MLDEEAFIGLLNKTGLQSGTAIGQALGVSRMAVQKKIQALLENGLPIKAVPSQGYRLEEGVQLLCKPQMLAGLKGDMVESLEVHQSIASTNSHLLGQSVLHRRARVCIAEAQQAGRGRRGNDWQSSPYRNIMMSLSWGFDHWPETITGLGLAVALTITECLNRQFNLGVTIKWPNDLLLEGDKLAGILIDVAGESAGACNVVIGIGLNVHQPDWSGGGDYRWQDLRSQGLAVDRNVLVCDFINALTEMLSEFEVAGFSPLVTRWNALSSYADQAIRVGDERSSVEGVMQGVDAAGALLLVDAAGELHRFADSNVSVRLLS